MFPIILYMAQVLGERAVLGNWSMKTSHVTWQRENLALHAGFVLLEGQRREYRHSPCPSCLALYTTSRFLDP